mmetsp:Transcript_25962/g.31413  ORF Transcript_25962/g.31413 Transcript_25962/m.31413 type:complete len:614 (+) Transcript_25962:3-1844(+)
MEDGGASVRTGVNVRDRYGDDAGVVPRALSELFDFCDKKEEEDCEVGVTLSYLQIYCELLQDLLIDDERINNDPSPPLSIREKNGHVFVENLTRAPVRDLATAMELVSAGDRRRTTRSTVLNEHSSRSHAVIIVTVTRRLPTTTTTKEAPSKRQKMRIGRLTMVDLAGSERAKKSKSLDRYRQFEELKSVNLSLSALGNCVAALSSPIRRQRRHVPYRDSKLTRLLQPCFEGGTKNDRTTLLLCLRRFGGRDDDDDRETFRALTFAQRAARVSVTSTTTTATTNDVADYESMYRELLARVDERDDEGRELRSRLAQMAGDVEEWKEAAARAEGERRRAVRSLADAEAGFRASLAAFSREDADKSSSSNSESGDFDWRDALETASEEWRGRFEALRSDHAREMKDAGVKHERQLCAYKSAASHATEELEVLERELEKERRDHLSALKTISELSLQLKDMDKEKTTRLTELHSEMDELQRQLDRKEEEYSSKEKEMRREIDDLASRLVASKENATSTKALKDMEDIFTDTVEKLSERVRLLESPSIGDVITQGHGNTTSSAEQKARRDMNPQARMLLEKMERNTMQFSQHVKPKQSTNRGCRNQRKRSNQITMRL